MKPFIEIIKNKSLKEGMIIENFIKQTLELGYKPQDTILELLPNNEYKIKEKGSRTTIIYFKIIEETE